MACAPADNSKQPIMTKISSRVEPPAAVLGLDIAKDSVVLYDAATNTTRTIENTPAALAAALAGYAGHALMVCEATGGYERAALDAACSVGLPAHKADAARVKAFIAAMGGAAKTDAIDARWLARYGIARNGALPRWRAPAPEREKLAMLVRHRQDLLQSRTRARNRNAAPGAAPLASFLEAEIAFLTDQIVTIDQASPISSPAIRPCTGPSGPCEPSQASVPSQPGPCWRFCPSSEPCRAGRSPRWQAWRPTHTTQAPSNGIAGWWADETASSRSCSWPPSARRAAIQPWPPSTSASSPQAKQSASSSPP